MTKNSDIKILVIDDKVMICDLLINALSSYPGFKASGTGMSSPGGVEEAFSNEYDVVLMDIDLVTFDVPKAVRSILSFQPAIKILILTTNIDLPHISEIFESGAVGFIHKKAEFREIALAIGTALKENIYFSPLIRQQLFRQPSAPYGEDKPLDVLSLRQKEVLALIAKGKPVEEIACTLNLSIRTVNLHRRNLTVKLGINNVADLTKYAIRKGLISTADVYPSRPHLEESIDR